MHKVLTFSPAAKLGCFTIALGLLAACGGGSSQTTDTSASPAPSVAASVGTSSAPVAAAFGGVRLPKGHELAALQQSCQICHSLDMVYTQRLSKKTWAAEVSKMIKFGAPLPGSDKAAVVAYLTKYLGPEIPRSNDRPTAGAPAVTYSAAPAQQ